MDETDVDGQLTDFRRLCSDLTLQSKKEGFFKVRYSVFAIVVTRHCLDGPPGHYSTG